MIGEEMNVHTAVGRFAVDRERETVVLTVNQYIQEGELVVGLPFYSELGGGRKEVERIEEGGEEIKVVGPESKDIVNITKPEGRAGTESGE